METDTAQPSQEPTDRVRTEREPTEEDRDVRPPAWRVPMALVTWAFVLLVLLIVLVLLVVKITRGSTTVPAPPVSPASAGVVQATTSVPSAVFDDVGAPAAEGPSPSVLSSQPPLTIGGLTGVVFVGGEFCPYCAAERWALVAALGRFGTFSNLGATSSSKFEVFPGTPTFSFDGARYRSNYVTLDATEEYGEAPSANAPAGFPKLEALSGFEQILVRRYGGSSSAAPSALPFMDVANRLVMNGASIGFSPAVLQGKSMSQIATDLSNPKSPIAEAVLGEANEVSAAICSADGGRPQSVCESPGVEAASARLSLP